MKLTASFFAYTDRILCMLVNVISNVYICCCCCCFRFLFHSMTKQAITATATKRNPHPIQSIDMRERVCVRVSVWACIKCRNIYKKKYCNVAKRKCTMLIYQ